MRMPPPAQMTPEQAGAHDAILTRRGHVRGPYLVWLRRPELCCMVEELNSYLRFRSLLPRRVAELAMLIANRHFDAGYVWANHARMAVEQGVPADAVAALARGECPAFEDAVNQAVYDYATQLLTTHFVSDATHAQTAAVLGEDALVDLVAALGSFSMLAMTLNAFRVPLHPGTGDPFPDIRDFAPVKIRWAFPASAIRLPDH